MNQVFKFGLVLAIICLTATLVLAVTYEVTKPKIEEQFKLEEQNALEVVLPGADSFVENAIDGIEYFEALKGGRLIGYCIRVSGTGYNGYIRMLVGIDTRGIIKGVKVLEHHETPGLGSKINEIKPGEKEPWFLAQFKGKVAKTLMLKKDIDAITGATISSKAVAYAIRDVVNEFLIKVKK